MTDDDLKRDEVAGLEPIIKNPEVYFIINTLPLSEQLCLIVNTTLANEEEMIIAVLEMLK